MNKRADYDRPTATHAGRRGTRALSLSVLALILTVSSCMNAIDPQVGGQATENDGGSISIMQSNSIPPWTPTSNPEDYYTDTFNPLDNPDEDRIEPINIVVRGPIGTLDNLKNRLEIAGKWLPLSGPDQCRDPFVTYNGNFTEFMWADDLSGSDYVFGLPVQQCGSGTRNHARVWKETSADYETIFIAASLETVRDAFPIPPPDHPFAPQSPVTLDNAEVFYMGRTNANVTTSCSSPTGSQNEAWHFRAVVPPGASVEYLTDDLNISNPGVTVWRNSTLGCDSRGSWPMLVQPNVALSDPDYGQVLDLYVVPFQAAADGHPADRLSYPTGRQPFYLQVTSGSTTQDVAVKSCGDVHCLTEDAFNLGRDDLFFHLDNALRDQGVGITAFTLDEHYVGNREFIRQPDNSEGYEFRSDGRIRVINIASLPVVMDPLEYWEEPYFGGLWPPEVGTNCSNPTDISGVQDNAMFRVSGASGLILLGYEPTRLINGEGGVWRNASLGCSSNGNWPMLYEPDPYELDVFVSIVPYGALPYEPGTSGYYILELETSEVDSNGQPYPTVYAKLEW